MQDKAEPTVAELEELLKHRAINFCNMLDAKNAMINQLIDEKKALRDENEELKAHIARIEADLRTIVKNIRNPSPCEGRIYSEGCAP